MRILHLISRTSAYFRASTVGLILGAGSLAVAEVDLGSAVQGIHGGDSRTAGIHGGDRSTLGIHGGDSRTSGIHGGDRSTLGIHGGDSRTAGIHGGDRSTRGIHGGDGRTAGIHGGDRSTQGIHGGDSRIFEWAAMGPVESLEVIDEGYRLTILGQTFISNLTSIPVAKGDYMLAAGSAESLDILMPIGLSYVAGASPVLVRGTVNNVESSTAELTVGDLAIDYSAHLSTDPTYSPEAGEAVEFLGVQPLPGGNAILNLQANTGSYIRGIHGGDSRTRGIHGGDSRTRGIHGGDSRTREIQGGDIR